LVLRLHGRRLGPRRLDVGRLGTNRLGGRRLRDRSGSSLAGGSGRGSTRGAGRSRASTMLARASAPASTRMAGAACGAVMRGRRSRRRRRPAAAPAGRREPPSPRCLLGDDFGHALVADAGHAGIGRDLLRRGRFQGALAGALMTRPPLATRVRAGRGMVTASASMPVATTEMRTLPSSSLSKVEPR